MPKVVALLLASILNIELIISGATNKSFFSFHTKDIRGNNVDLGQYNGKVTLLVNTASQCSFTESHFKSLKRLHDILSYGNKFNVIVVPSNDFGDQEPWDEIEIEEYIRGHFKGEFPILAKSHVIGDEVSDLWKWVSETSSPPKWNFDKYLINQEGQIVRHWTGDTTVESIFATIQNLVDGIDTVIGTEFTTPITTTAEDVKGDDAGKDEL